ncbi:oxoglutarate/iron-dependent dioxygenase [Artemisia annua]|uniref:Oxoglutarate/iron-dependent dioxygenase n=1 Tax=Artemisia annua TaxID=35608 RepID=A0A2U1PVN1_ARTAN|nr:oxoglutarate/iron-dependent dioxygenase [Artemisia annua]
MISNHLILLIFVVNKGHGVKGLSELGPETVSYQYIQPPHERLDMGNEESNKDSILVIDMSNWEWDDPKVAQAIICDTTRKWWFFLIVNHRVPIHVLEDVKDAALKFFALLVEEKQKYSKEKSVTNSVCFGIQALLLKPRKFSCGRIL